MDRKYIKQRAFLLMFCLFLCSKLWADPDVFFSDSDNYNGAYLAHEFNGNKIKFLLTKPILYFQLPDEFFELEDLKNYINNTHNFPSSSMKNEFNKMLEQSFKSEFKAEKFLEELMSVFAGFRQGAALPDTSSGGCASVAGDGQSAIYLVFLILYALRRPIF